jgi:hypothetical protein
MPAKGNEKLTQNFGWKASREKTTCEMRNSYNDVNDYVISRKVSCSIPSINGPEIVMSEIKSNTRGISSIQLPLHNMTCLKTCLGKQ